MPSVPSGTPTTDNLPNGLDRADGQNGRLGQATTGLTVQSGGQSGTDTTIVPLNEMPDSPVLERAEQCTVRHSYTGNPAEMLTRWTIYPRGTLVADSAANYYRILSTTYNQLRADLARLDIVSEAVSFDSPPDEFSVNPVKLGLDIMKHPRYFYALMPTSQIPGYSGTPDSTDEINAKQTIIRAIQAYRENPFIPTAGVIDNINGALHDNIAVTMNAGKIITLKKCPNFSTSFPATDPCPVGTTPPATPTAGNNPKFQYVYVDYTSSASVQLALAAAQELIGKLWRMEDAPLVNGVEIVWSQYFWRPPYLDLGGYTQDPIYNTRNPLPDYFYSPSNPPASGVTLFDYLCQYNPQCFSSDGTGNAGTTNISWLRDADTIEFQRTWFKVTHKWLGAPIGAWDGDIYAVVHRPNSPSDYKVLTFA